MKKSAEEALTYLKRLLKGLILFGWIYLLITTSLYTATNSFAGKVYALFDINQMSLLSTGQDINRVLPYSELQLFLVKYDDQPPPIEDILNNLFPSWANGEITLPGKTTQNEDVEIIKWKQEQYKQLFKRIDARLNALAKTTTGVEKFKLTFSYLVPSTFTRHKDNLTREIPIPDAGINWINAEKERLQSKQTRTSVIDLFVMLMVLGAFGSLIFLTRDYMLTETDDSVTLGSYIFRPILGMFLAVAMFIVDIAAHTLISSSGVTSIRHETLYLLAFAAGLLSEQAYSLVYVRAAEILKSMEKKKEVEAAIKAKQHARVNAPSK